ncbi:uncharacterized protein simc1 [Mastacembelus armatus]|uniref:SUMO interacting motifs containing 1 n=1 Tax=Mastacembelus armatus TaxID=205130 RepID=A0A3Q3LM85_9TELE|nr:SUMO-interacting motif-containing protein 1 [Mastacembelus armatus]
MKWKDWGDMADVITLSSDESDVEIVGSYNNLMTEPDPLPLSAVRVDVDVVNANVPPRYIDLTDPRWTLPELKLRSRQNTIALTVVDLTESDIANVTEQETENFPPDDCQIVKESTNTNQTVNKQEFQLQKNSSRDLSIFPPQQDCSNLKQKMRRTNSQTRHEKQIKKTPQHKPAVKLNRLPFLETHYRELETSTCSVHLTKDCMQMSLSFKELDNSSEAHECISNLRTTASSGPHMEHSLDASPPMAADLLTMRGQEDRNQFNAVQLHDTTSQQLQQPTACTDTEGSVTGLKEHKTHEGLMEDNFISLSGSPSISHDKAQREVMYPDVEHLEVDKAGSRRSFSNESKTHSPPTRLDVPVPFDHDYPSHSSNISQNPQNQVVVTPTSEYTPAENVSEWQVDEVTADRLSNSPDFLRFSIPSEPESECMDERSVSGTYRGDLGVDSPVSFLWQEDSDKEVNEENRYDMSFRAASKEDRHFVCPVALRKIMSGSAHALIDAEDDGFGTPEVLCRQSLSLVYSTIDENYTEGTLQLLSDLLQPGYYPPKDITTHLLSGILLEQQCPHHLCVQAFNLLMRTQRHHIADKTTVPWNWELLTSVMENQKHRSEVVRMFLEYVIQTLEDDFQAKHSVLSLHHSIAKTTLSCDQQFPRVRDVIKWLFAAIMKSTDNGQTREAAREKDEQIRIVCIFQRMLSLALEVDRSPALSSAKLSQELFHMLISNVSLREHRMLLLESLQSKLLICKLLEHLLDYACPVKIPLPMSLSLLLHFLKNCTLEPDPRDGSERWQRWEELVHLLWMLLLSYNKAMKGYLCNSAAEQSGKVGTLVYKPDDKISDPAIREAVEAFLSRSQSDLRQALPLHVEESLMCLQDHLLDACQC